jgi:hypothetical protein
MPPADPGNELVVAGRVLYELLGRRWVWPPVRAVEEYETTVRTIHLAGRPVRDVFSVTVDGEDITGYRVMSGAFIQLPRKCGGLMWNSYSGYFWTGLGLPNFDPLNPRCPPPVVVVDYLYGSEAPAQVDNAIAILADEISKFYDDDDECRLPSRVREVASRGITMDLVPSEEWLTEGRTGIPEVDFAISVFNPSKAKRRARVFSADHRPGRRHQRTGS